MRRTGKGRPLETEGDDEEWLGGGELDGVGLAGGGARTNQRSRAYSFLLHHHAIHSLDVRSALRGFPLSILRSRCLLAHANDADILTNPTLIFVVASTPTDVFR